ncbi:MAG: tRNA (adenosine(37)-N6)-threonylcarbamoyltransferase complex transferase subunit TsaD [Candidatus Latescibacteria bacterium]|nr:tRNA (adenosine(37)-N6)-threonylcarbamoyltransferase complex transferase subunit TsaD [bacterium]MBD3423707.1 tRNA (adenosine(37)-N6)-threonylcarbamoyltransferase complex transferase subunit TsaD [Candidatus Latescibacterota bacterium]
MEKVYLGIETSCDDTSCALYSRRAGVIIQKTATQMAHQDFGGVVPEIASRTHMKTLLPLYRHVLREGGIGLEELAGIGVTNGPGLTGSLLVGLSFAKGISYGGGVPLAGVHHLEGHILANDLEGGLETPCLVLVVSGGHTQILEVEQIGRYRFLGGTRDDAAGEAFDKTGKLLGLPYPGGPNIEKAAREGDPGAYDFPRGLINSGECDYSFSGLKTAVKLQVESMGDLSSSDVSDIAASVQEAIVDVLVRKAVLAAERSSAERIYLAGGVAANGRLREFAVEMFQPLGVQVSWPRMEYCTDNAAMIACAASYRIEAGVTDGMELNSFPRGELKSWR